jgi:hypothetical protein
MPARTLNPEGGFPVKKPTVLALLFFPALLIFSFSSQAADINYICSPYSNMCIHQHGAVQDQYGRVTQWPLVNASNVKIELIYWGSDHNKDYFWLQFHHSGKCVHQYGAVTTNGGRIVQRTCDDTPNTLIWLQPISEVPGTVYYYLHFKHSNMCIHTPSGVQDADLVKWDCYGRSDFQWKLIPAPSEP